MSYSPDSRDGGEKRRGTVAVKSMIRRNRPVSSHLHPAIYWTIVGLAGWLVLSVWGFFGSGYAGLALAVVSIFIGIAVAIPLLLWAIARRHPPAHTDPRDSASFNETLSEWLAHKLDINTGQMKATVAAVEILLPIAAVAFGMTVFALVRHLDGVV
ncbi:MAG TPA: hypothetical protein VET89_07010 [Stellaceae bacterium]|nr:hypothetical protein [Stellaceae bacterium]